MRKERLFLSVQFVGNKAGWSRWQKNKSFKPLCLRKNKTPKYLHISILTSVSLAAFNPTIRAFRSEIAKHLPAKPELLGMFQNGLKRVLS